MGDNPSEGFRDARCAPPARTEIPAMLEASLPSGMVLRIPVGAEVSYVRQLLSALA